VVYSGSQFEGLTQKSHGMLSSALRPVAMPRRNPLYPFGLRLVWASLADLLGQRPYEEHSPSSLGALPAGIATASQPAAEPITAPLIFFEAKPSLTVSFDLDLLARLLAGAKSQRTDQHQFPQFPWRL